MMRYTLLLFLLTALFVDASAQGCSDAGFCTLPGLTSDEEPAKKHSFTLSLNQGRADHDIAILGGYLQYSHFFSDKLSWNTRLTFIQQEGDITRSRGFSDVFFSGTYALRKETNFTLGLKLPLSTANATFDGNPLPMDYQSSLGTIDLLLGLQHAFNRLTLSLGYQQPMRQNNNSFSNAMDPFSAFQPTNRFIRQADLLLKADYIAYSGKKLTILPGVLPIYHLANDRYTNASGKETSIPGSQGLTLNATLAIAYQPKNNQTLSLRWGMPLTVRKARPDGLTRHYVISLEYDLGW